MEKVKTQRKLGQRLKQKWIKGLRQSKQIKPCIGWLKHPSAEEYDAIGVLLKEHNIDTLGHAKLGSWTSEFKGIPKYLYNGENSIADRITKFNDSGRSFKWIATYIEKHL